MYRSTNLILSQNEVPTQKFFKLNFVEGVKRSLTLLDETIQGWSLLVCQIWEEYCKREAERPWTQKGRCKSENTMIVRLYIVDKNKYKCKREGTSPIYRKRKQRFIKFQLRTFENIRQKMAIDLIYWNY